MTEKERIDALYTKIVSRFTPYEQAEIANDLNELWKAVVPMVIVKFVEAAIAQAIAVEHAKMVKQGSTL